MYAPVQFDVGRSNRTVDYRGMIHGKRRAPLGLGGGHMPQYGARDVGALGREIAGLPSINNNVVVDLTLQFDAD